jgi:hypothetical protein
MQRAIHHAPLTVLSAAILALLMMPALRTSAAPQGKPLTEQEVLELVQGGVAGSRVSAIVDDRGIDFDFTPEVEQRIRRAGGTDDVVEAIGRAAQRRAESQRPRTGELAIRTTPGELQVYLNDELKGMTSPEGELRVTNLQPGTYNLRVSLLGYQTYEKPITVSAGEEQTLSVTLVQKPGDVPPRPKAVPVEEPPAPTSGIPVPGVKVVSLQFYEGPHAVSLPQSQRVYRFSFDRFTTRAIYWELDLTFPAPGRHIDFDINARWYKPDGSEMSKQLVTAHVDADWHSSWHSRGYGFPEPGHWTPGTYRVDLYCKSLRIASETFQIN